LLLNAGHFLTVDVWDGPDNNGPVVCHGNTLTTKIPFTDVVQVICEYAFEASK
jgi:Phosphatidylinositol-specific phospholipase C, X domain